jgi:hypothetical protein
MGWGISEYYTNDFGFGLLNLFLIPLVIFDLVLRGFALWRAAKNNQNIWFIALLIVNSAGILPLIYLVLNREQVEVVKKSKKK